MKIVIFATKSSASTSVTVGWGGLWDVPIEVEEITLHLAHREPKSTQHAHFLESADPPCGHGLPSYRVDDSSTVVEFCLTEDSLIRSNFPDGVWVELEV